MRKKGRDIKDCKKRGEWAELEFMARAAGCGLNVAKPWGESQRYDIGIEHKGKFLRVQVKCATYRRLNRRSYFCNVRPCSLRHHYRCNEVDLFALYIIPEDVWYIIPARIIATKTNVLLSPHWKGHKYERYIEAWHLFREKKA